MPANQTAAVFEEIGSRQKPPMVSVCVVTYNQERYISQCLQSIVDQVTDFAFEVLVADDCSTDNTLSIIMEFHERYPSLIVPILRNKNVGASENFVDTHNRATGEFVAHCDGDDIFLPGKLQKQAQYLNQNPRCPVVWHYVNLFDDAGNFFPGKSSNYPMLAEGKITFSHALRLGSIGVHSSIMYRRSARKTFAPNFQTLDLFYTWEYLSQGDGFIMPEVLGEYRVNTCALFSINNKSLIRSLNCHHADFFLSKFPGRRKDVFIFALTNLIIDIKNRRQTFIGFFFLCIKSFSLVSPFEFVRHILEIKLLCVPKLTCSRNDCNF